MVAVIVCAAACTRPKDIAWPDASAGPPDGQTADARAAAAPDAPVGGDAAPSPDGPTTSNGTPDATPAGMDGPPPVPDGRQSVDMRPAEADARLTCGDGVKSPGEECDNGAANVPNGYGATVCTTDCKLGGTCGDGVRQGPEKCDGGKAAGTALGACDPECTGFYEKKRILGTAMRYPGDLGGIRGADGVCQAEYGGRGGTWKAMIVGGDRRATVTPLKADGQLDWVIHRYRHYHNELDELLWRTDDVPLLGVREGKRMAIYAKAFTDYRYPWGGYSSDWTTIESEQGAGHCHAWTYGGKDAYGGFPLDDLTKGAGELCSTEMPLLCVEQ